MRKLFIIILVARMYPLCAQQVNSINLDVPPTTVSLLGKNLISTHCNERDFALSPDGNELFYTITLPKSTFQTIVYCKKNGNNSWTQPEVATFAGEFSDLEPVFSTDGNTLYFSSNRPITGNTPKDFDIWKVVRTNHTWSKPENLGLPINTAADEFYPSIAKNGNLYFTATYPDGVGKEDIYMSVFFNDRYQKPIVLDTGVNSSLYEFNAFVSPDEQYILFTSYGRKDDTGGGDLYISTKDAGGKWKPAKNLKELNSRQLDYCPFVSPDGSSLFFTSERHNLPVSFLSAKANYKSILDISGDLLNGSGNIYWIDFKKILKTYK